MDAAENSRYSIAYKWLSYLLVAGMVYYWLFTLGLIFFNKSLHNSTPRQTAVYNAFWHQNWRLFAVTKPYNRELDMVIRQKADPAKTDTIDLVKYSVAEKRKHAPFNNYEDALDHMLYGIMNGLEMQLYYKHLSLKKQYPGRPDSFYMRRGNQLLLADSLRQQRLQNLYQYGRYVMRQIQWDTAGKEFQLIVAHKFIPPQKPPESAVTEGDRKIVFVSPYQSF